MQEGFDGILMFPKHFVYFRLIGNEVTHKCHSVKTFIQHFRFLIGIRTKVNDVSLEQFASPFLLYSALARACKEIIAE